AAGGVGIGEHRTEERRLWRPPPRWNQVSRKGVAHEIPRRIFARGQWIVYWTPAREIAGQFFGRRHDVVERRPLARAAAFVIGEEESMVAEHRPAQRRAKLISFQWRPRLCEKVARLELFVA